MVIKVYVSSTSGNMEIKRKQEFIHQLLQVKGIEFEEIDITATHNDEHKVFMWQHAQSKEGERNPLPPQVFNDGSYCGDFDGFHEANETESVMDFLKMDQGNGQGDA